MSRFNLTFSGEILTGADPSEVRERFGELFGIEDTDRVERFFSGQKITLRRNLNRKEAAYYYHQLHLLGAVAGLVKITEAESAHQSPKQPLKQPLKQPRTPADTEHPPAETESNTQQIADTASTDTLGQVWAVSSKGATPLNQRKVSGAPTRRKKKPIDISARIKAGKEAARTQTKGQGETDSTRLSATNVKQHAEKAVKKQDKRPEAQEKQRPASELPGIDELEQENIRTAHSNALHKRLTAKQVSDERLLDIDEGAQTSTAQSTGIPASPEAIGAARAVNTSVRGANPPARTRQAGEPNFYNIRPFRNSKKVRMRASSAIRTRRRSLQLGTAAALLLLVSASQLFSLQDKGQLNRHPAAAIDNHSGVVLLAEDALLMHDRAGVFQTSVTAKDLGLHSLQSPLAFDSLGTMIITGSTLTDTGEASSAFLARCNMQEKSCTPLLQNNLGMRQFIINPVDDSILLAGAGQLIKVDAQGKISAHAELALPESAMLRLHAGLLFISSVDGPAISVYRYETSAFAKQLDEILLIPPPAVEAGRSQVANFVWSANAWWVVLRNPDSGDQGLYRFDENWGFLDEIKPLTSNGPLELISWGEKTLVNNFRGADIARFNAAGKPEIPFTSSRLAEIWSTREEHSNLARWLWQGGVGFASLLLLVSMGAVFFSGLRLQIYKSHRASGAEPVDEYAPNLRWIDPAVDRADILRQRSISYYLIALAIVIIAAAQSVGTWHMCALLLFLSGPGIALSVLRRSNPGQIGIFSDRLLLVDHTGMYHIACGSNIQFRGSFLAIDDVIVFTGSRLLPAFDENQLNEWALPLLAAGIKVDSKTIIVKLLQARHPIALAVWSLVGGSLSALLALGLRTVFQS